MKTFAMIRIGALVAIRRRGNLFEKVFCKHRQVVAHLQSGEGDSKLEEIV